MSRTPPPALRYKLLGRSGLRVSEFALGTGTFGTRWGWGADPAESRRVFDGFAEAGGTFLDTADVYQFGESEEILADLIAADRGHFVVGTKYSSAPPVAGGSVTKSGNSRKHMIQALEASLRRLRTDYVDLYWVHVRDGDTPVDEIMRGFDDLVRAGKVLYAGLSDFPAWTCAQAAVTADLRGWAPLAAVQLEYSLVERTAERELLPMARELGLGVTAWSPLGGGLLTGKYAARPEADGDAGLRPVETAPVEGRGTKGGGPFRAAGERERAVVDAVRAVAGELGATPSQVALAWVRARLADAPGGVTILGARTRAQLDDNLGSLGVALGADQLARLDAASAITLGFPHDVLRNPQFRAMASGGAWDRIDHRFAHHG